MPDRSESDRFAEIVAALANDDRSFAVGVAPDKHLRARVLLVSGFVLWLAAVALFLFGGVGAMVIAVVPGLVGLLCVIGSRVWT